MSQDHSPDSRSGRPEIVEWGGGEGRGPGRPPRALPGILRDRRLVPVVAGVGLVAVFASFLGEWSTLTIPNEGPSGTSPIRVSLGVADIATYGVAYLVGELAVTGALALVLFGAPTVRHNSRIVGIATAGGLLALLAAATTTLDESAPWPFLLSPEIKLEAEPGRGLVMAYAGTAGLGLALYLAGRFVPPPADPAGADRFAGATSDADDPEGGDDWPWRRPPRAAATDGDDGAPIDLTVAPTTPFALPDQQDRR